MVLIWCVCKQKATQYNSTGELQLHFLQILFGWVQQNKPSVYATDLPAFHEEHLVSDLIEVNIPSKTNAFAPPLGQRG